MPSIVPDPRIYGAVPLSRYRARAVVDRIGVVIRVRNPINYVSVRRALGSILGLVIDPAVKALDEAFSGGVATIFKFDIQDVAKYAEIERVMKKLGQRFEFNGPPRIYHLEIALDFYSIANDRVELETIETRLMREAVNFTDHPRQFVRHHPRSRGILRYLEDEDEDQVMRSGETLYAGTMGDSGWKYKIYSKVIDRGKFITDITEHRTRFEVTATTKLPYPSLPELARLKGGKFQGAADYFRCRHVVIPKPRFVKGKDMANLLEVRKERTLLRWARNGLHAIPVKSRRKYPVHTLADQPLNKMIRDRLRRLSERW